jgi:SAM-dependent methyltransferase
MPGIGTEGVSEALRKFVEEVPYERRAIYDFVAAAARSLQAGSKVADVGAGDAPYRELFSHTRYTTIDWEGSEHADAAGSDIIATADAIPVDDSSFDAVLLTQVLEHVPDPGAVLKELHRILVPGGRLFLSAPLAWELHEIPYDFYRYTRFGLEHLAAAAGFAEIEVEPRNDCFTTVAQLLLNLRAAMGRAPDGLDARREEASRVLEELAGELAALAPLDVSRILPLGYTLRARRT